MLSAIIPSEHSYPALPLVGQLVDQRLALFDPLVLEEESLRLQRPQQMRTDSLLLDDHIHS